MMRLLGIHLIPFIKVLLEGIRGWRQNSFPTVHFPILQEWLQCIIISWSWGYIAGFTESGENKLIIRMIYYIMHFPQKLKDLALWSFWHLSIWSMTNKACFQSWNWTGITIKINDKQQRTNFIMHVIFLVFLELPSLCCKKKSPFLYYLSCLLFLLTLVVLNLVKVHHWKTLWSL